jgi:hypothetical protein
MNQSVFASLYKHWIWIGPLMLVAAAAALVYLIVGVVSTIRNAHLFKAPLSERQEVQFGDAGTVVLSTEGPRFSRRFASVKFELRGIDGDPVPGRRALFRAQTSGISTVRTEHLILDIPRPGRYILTMIGLDAPRDNDASHAVVFMRPHLARSMSFVVGIVLASAILVGSLVTFILRLRGAAPET